VLVFMSAMAFRRARNAGRSGLLWVGMVWFASIACGMLFNICYLVLLASTTNPVVEQHELRSMMYLPTAVGMFAGAAFTTTLSGRPTGNPRLEKEDG